VNKVGVPVYLEKIKAIQEWSTPKIVGEVRTFHGLTSFCRRFIPNFSTLASSLKELFKKYMSFDWVKKKVCFSTTQRKTHQCIHYSLTRLFKNF